MAVKLRLRRLGRTHAPFYQIVAAEANCPRDGRFIEKLGYYNPFDEVTGIKVDHEAALKWLKNGAQPTETVKSIFSHEGILLKHHLYRQGKSAEEITKAYETWHQSTEAKKQKAVDAQNLKKAETQKARMEHEKKVRQDRAEKIISKRTQATKPANEAAE